MKGATRVDLIVMGTHGISIHAPVKGATQRTEFASSLCEFQSTPP